MIVFPLKNVWQKMCEKHIKNTIKIIKNPIIIHIFDLFMLPEVICTEEQINGIIIIRLNKYLVPIE